MSQYNSLESELQIGLIFFYFEDYSKSARGMILFLLVTCSYIPILLKNAEKPTVIWLSTEIFLKAQWPLLIFFSFVVKFSRMLVAFILFFSHFLSDFSKMEFLSEEKSGLFIDLTQSKEEISKTNFVVKEGSTYKIRISFQVQREIVTGKKQDV